MNQQSILDLLAATGPYSEHAEELMLYGQFVGSWDINAIYFRPDGTQKTAQGEWHFGWILGGRGVQDVLYPVGAPSHKYGTTLRCYDPKAGIWHITWMQPCASEFNHLIGRKIGDRIVQDEIKTGPGRRERWSFTEITPNSFLWIGESSTDEGVTWVLEQEMRGKRRDG